MSPRSIYLLAALIGGAVLPVQVALNALLKGYISQPMQITFISYLAGTIASLTICFFGGDSKIKMMFIGLISLFEFLLYFSLRYKYI